MAIRTVIEEEIAERSSALYVGTLLQEDGTPIGSSTPGLTLTLTLYALDAAKTILNDVEAVDILNTGRGTLSVDGVLTIQFEADDAEIVNPRRMKEQHVALIEATWDPNHALRHELLLTVVNLSKVG